jgi:hypothetical protein
MAADRADARHWAAACTADVQGTSDDAGRPALIPTTKVRQQTARQCPKPLRGFWDTPNVPLELSRWVSVGHLKV